MNTATTDQADAHKQRVTQVFDEEFRRGNLGRLAPLQTADGLWVEEEVVVTRGCRPAQD